MPSLPIDPTAAAVSPWQRLRPLPGRTPLVRASRAEGRSRLWLDERNLVQETVRGNTQDIRRFSFDDIQAIQIRRTVRGMVYNLVLLALLLLPAISLVSAMMEKFSLTPDRVSLLVLCGFLTALLTINLLRGPTCRTVLTTALGPQVLTSLSRLRTARRALDQIAGGVESIQGALTPDEAIRQVDQRE